MPVVAGVDSSTQSTTVGLYDAETGALLGVGSAPHQPTFPPVSEQWPADWWTALGVALEKAKRAASVAPDDILGISVAAQCHGLVALGRGDDVIRPAKLWNDTTSAPQAKRLQEELGTVAWANRVGSVPPPAFTITKLAWLREHEPENFDLLARVALPHDWLTLQLTGSFVSDRSDASGTGYYSSSREAYDLAILSMVDGDRDWGSMLPLVHRPDQPAGSVLPAAAEELGISPIAIVGAGSGDQHAGAIGLGARPGDLVFVFGTSGVVYGLSADEVHDETGAVNSVADATGGYQPLVCTLNAAKVTDAVARLLGVDHDGLSALAQSAERSPDRPVMSAFFDGERTPDRPGARGTLAGLSTQTTREQLALAAFEGVVFGLDAGRRALAQNGVPMGGRVIATGGGAASAAYLRTLADTVGREVETVAASQPVAAGAAAQAAAILSGVPITTVRDAWAPHSFRTTPPQTPVDASVIDRYSRTAAWEGLDS